MRSWKGVGRRRKQRRRKQKRQERRSLFLLLGHNALGSIKERTMYTSNLSFQSYSVAGRGDSPATRKQRTVSVTLSDDGYASENESHRGASSLRLSTDVLTTCTPIDDNNSQTDRLGRPSNSMGGRGCKTCCPSVDDDPLGFASCDSRKHRRSPASAKNSPRPGLEQTGTTTHGTERREREIRRTEYNNIENKQRNETEK